jgi:hypothetical protein
MHSVKNALIATEKNKIVYLSKTYSGSVHDKRIVDEEQWKFPRGIKVSEDLGFDGHFQEGVNIERPTKKPKGKELTMKQKIENKEKASDRVKVEHIIGEMKVYRIIKDTIRLWKKTYNDINDFVIEICCGLHNFKNQYRI